jgi:Conserved nitrate reductase-associated protein (Nitr_red_assoc)
MHGSQLGRLTVYRVHAPHSERVAPTMDATDLEFIPRAVRDKLDQVAIKLHLAQWQALTLEERRELYEMP